MFLNTHISKGYLVDTIRLMYGCFSNIKILLKVLFEEWCVFK